MTNFRLKSNGSSTMQLQRIFCCCFCLPYIQSQFNRSVSTFVQYLQYTYSSLFSSMACVLGILFTFPTWALFRQRACTYLGHTPQWAQKRKSNKGNCTWKSKESQLKAIFLAMRKIIYRRSMLLPLNRSISILTMNGEIGIRFGNRNYFLWAWCFFRAIGFWTTPSLEIFQTQLRCNNN